MGIVTLVLAAAVAVGSYRTAELGKTPFAMETVPEYVFPARTFSVIDCGAVADGRTKSTAAIQAAIDRCAEAGGGRVIVPKGVYFSAPIRLRSNVELHLDEGATLEFTDDPKDCLPPVMSSWEGLECLNYSPMVYAFGCTNVALTGRGTLVARMDGWKRYFRESATGIQDARRILYTWGSTDVPVAERDITKASKAVMRPQLVQFNRSKNIRIEDVELKDSPFWTLHLYQSENVVVRRLRTNCYGFNNDGMDIEMTRNVLVEDCTIQAGDDGFVFKAGRNRDAWRVACPTENVVVRNCRVLDAVSLFAIGSEMSGGVRNVWIHDCDLKTASRALYVKTNHRRGGFVDNIVVENVTVGSAYQLFSIETDILYQWSVFPDYERRLTDISNIVLRNVTCREACYGLVVEGDPERPVDGVRIENVTIGRVQAEASRIRNARNVTTDRYAVRDYGKISNPWMEKRPKMPPPTVAGNRSAKSAWSGRRVAVLGDSISDPRHIGCSRNYWEILAKRLGCDVWVYAVNGARLDGLLKQAEILRRDLGRYVDAILVFGGTNDFNGDVPQGTWYDVAEEEVNRKGKAVRLPRRRLSMDATTFRGRTNRLLEYLKRTFPTQQIVLLTPVHRGFATFGPTNVQPDESFPNACGVWFDGYVADLRAAADIWSVPLVDLYRESGLTPTCEEHYRYFHDADTDMLHPNDHGQARIAETILAKLLTLPPEFKIREGVAD